MKIEDTYSDLQNENHTCHPERRPTGGIKILFIKTPLGRSRSFAGRNSSELSKQNREAGSIMDCGWLTNGKVTFRLHKGFKPISTVGGP